MLRINYSHEPVGYKGVEANYYLDGLCKILQSVTKEAYIECIQLKKSGLEKIVKASSNSERLIIRYSDIPCLMKLDFTSETKYKTNFMSFCNCGGTGAERKSDFIIKEERFRRIVKAICRSGLKDSLKTLDISGCKLKLEQVKSWFTEFGMEDISIITDGCVEPLDIKDNE